ncbi:MAG: hypothetical protein Kow002_09770 [Anaerolineales bacterium]
MKVFVSIKVPRADAELRQAADMLAETITSAGHQPFVATDEIAARGLSAPGDFMPFARQNLLDSDLVILLYHPELRGGLIEAGMAYAQNIPIWLCHRADERVSSSMRGCADVTIEYESLDELQRKLLNWLNERG